jgi:hypothetical protein
MRVPRFAAQSTDNTTLPLAPRLDTGHFKPKRMFPPYFVVVQFQITNNAVLDNNTQGRLHE